MKFHHVNCVVCHRDYFDEDQVIAFRRGLQLDGIERIFLDGRQPWCGIVCVCRNCAAEIAWEF